MKFNRTYRRSSGALLTECVVALGILAAVMIPLGLSFVNEARACRAYYHRAAVLEIIDGEMETLVSGEWRSFKQGEQPYEVHAASVTNLPSGHFLLTLNENKVRLDWLPATKAKNGKLTREARLK
jgi:hypothetical protein